ncbi:MAG: transcription-repair coupling factor, partial [Myxococcales bacterium]|nr:transcription-repair coupling factor [Myxococcales bacterium]
IDQGRAFYGLDAFLPAFYEKPETLLDFLPAGHRKVVLDPSRVGRAATDEHARARADHSAKVEEGLPAFPVETLFLPIASLEANLLPNPTVFHRVVVEGGEDGSGPEPLETLERPGDDPVLHLGGDDHRALAADLSHRRSQKSSADTLRPVVDRIHQWLGEGLRVVFTARTLTQVERLHSVLRGYAVPLGKKPDGLVDWTGEPKPHVEIAVSSVSSGFFLPTEGLVVVTDEEVFGTRSHRRTERNRAPKKLKDALQDLRELHVGDYVVHIEHGVGKYLGLERKALGQTAQERMLGAEPVFVELLLIEYAGGDKLFLPVTRLNQIQKFASQETHTPKIDRLGGQTFAKTKARVREHVRRLADDLLRLYAERAAVQRDPLPPAGREFAEFEATFPFEETRDQAKAIDDVLSDLAGEHPMDRVVCGDVGFGKTEVAIRAAFRVAMAGRQVALLCPTTVLAQQHFLNVKNRLEEYPLRVEVLSRFVDRAEQARVLAGLKDGTVDVVIGTHRLLSKDVHFAKLGLLVVDEEQRFGVTHKERIKGLRKQVDVLTLSATPIPRTMQMAVGGLRDLSLIATPPVDRRAVRTFVSRWDDHILREAIEREMARGGQVFFVFNRIEGLYERAQRISELVPEARVAVGHGQMKESELEKVMIEFVDAQYDILCATAIIESGLDIPRANTIIIDRADIFGLAQLYQLRGRVGRSRERAYCYLLTPPAQRLSDDARYRIETLERFTELGSGFHVASVDMELRGAGDLLGAEQSGNVASVGFDLFMQMLAEAIAELRGEEVVHEIDPEMSFDVELHIPDEYIEDVGVRLSCYKRFAAATSEEDVDDLAAELEDRFGPPPAPTRQLIRAMRLRPALRHLRVVGSEASPTRIALHLSADTPLDPVKVMAKVAMPASPWALSPDMKLTRRYEPGEPGDSIDRLGAVLDELSGLVLTDK